MPMARKAAISRNLVPAEKKEIWGDNLKQWPCDWSPDVKEKPP